MPVSDRSAAGSRRERPWGDALLAAQLGEEPAVTDWAALGSAFAAGDAAAADALLRHALPRITRLVQRLSAWSGDADDLVQDVLVTALARRTQFRGAANPETWLTRIAINCCRAHARRAWVRRRLWSAWAATSSRTTGSNATVPPADGSAIEDEQANAVRAAVARLPAKQREAIVLCYLEHLTPVEAAAALGVRPGTVEVWLTRARQQLRTLVKQFSPQFPRTKVGTTDDTD